MYELHWTWGIFDDNSKWYLKVEAVDTDMYAVAYYSPDDNNPLKLYESTNSELLKMLIDAENSELFKSCKDKKDMHFGLKDSFSDITVANFM